MILVVDDDSAMRKLLVDDLQDDGCCVVEASDGKEALSQVGATSPDFIVTDLRMPFGGFDYLRELKLTVPECPIIVITAFGDSQTKAKVISCGVSAYFDKPMRISDLKATMSQVCRMNPCPYSKKDIS